jgi:two-component system sensor histidine kinase AlgZ
VHPLLAQRGRIGLYLAGWVPLGALLASLLVLQGKLPWPQAAALVGPLTLLYAFMCLPAWYLCRAFPVEISSPQRLLVVQVVAALLSALLWSAVGFGWATVLARLSGVQAFSNAFREAFPLFLGTGTVAFVAVGFVHYMIIAWQATAEADRRSLQLAVLAREAELKALRMQLAPHFLFNSLNSISALTAASPEKAREMCILLASFLRKSLALGARDQVTLDEELSLISDFLAIERVRFGARLETSIQIDEEAKRCVLPPLLLQPLVENAINHGVAQTLEGGTISLSAKRSGSRVILTVENPRDADSPSRPGAGVGLQIVRRRLDTAFGAEGRLDVHKDDTRFKVRMVFPARLESQKPSEPAAAR